MPRILVAGLLALALSGCTWVRLTEEGQAVRVADGSESLSHCEAKGLVTASVRARVGMYERNRLKVADEVEALARNDAVRLGANTLRPEGELVDGERRYAAFKCPR